MTTLTGNISSSFLNFNPLIGIFKNIFAGVSGDVLLLEDDVSFLLLEDNTSALLLE